MRRGSPGVDSRQAATRPPRLNTGDSYAFPMSPHWLWATVLCLTRYLREAKLLASRTMRLMALRQRRPSTWSPASKQRRAAT